MSHQDVAPQARGDNYAATLAHLRSQRDGAPPAEVKQPPHPFRRLWDLGYRRLVPIIPPGADLSPASYLAKALERGRDNRGKAPGSRNDAGQWGGLGDWQNRQATERDLDRWHAMGAGVGLVADGSLVLVDIDARDEATAAAIEADAVRILGPAPLRVGAWPKRLLVYASAEPVDNAVLTFQGSADVERVEVLAQAKQAVVDGGHARTGKPYEWRRALPPRDALTIVSREQVAAFLEVQRRALPSAIVHASAAPIRANVDQTSLAGPLELVRAAVAAIPNGAHFADRRSWIGVLAAIKAALPYHPDEATALAVKWSVDWTDGHNDPDAVAETFRTLGTGPFSVGAPYLYGLARRLSGWIGHWWDGEAAAVAATAAAVAPGADDWPEPADLFGENDPAELGTPPAGSMPSILERWAVDEARRKGVPVAFAAAAGLGVLSSAIGASLRIRPRLHDDGWLEPAALWIVLVADPGSAKSPTIGAAVAPAKAIDREWRKTDQPRRDAWEAARKRRPAANAPPVGPEPRVRRLVIDDATSEKQLRIHADNPRGLLRAPDELVGLLGSLGAYKRAAEGDRTTLLRMFDGGDVGTDRVGSGTVAAEVVLMGLVAGTQPEKIAALTRDLGGDGMLQRMLFVLDDEADRRGMDEPADCVALEAYATAVRTLATSDYGTVPIVVLTPAASAVTAAARADIERLTHLPGATPAWGGHVSKWGRFLPRIVLTFHALAQLELFEAVMPNIPVEAATVERAVAFSRFLLRHQLRFYETYYGARPSANEAREIAGHFLTKPGLSRVTRRDVGEIRPRTLRGVEGRRMLFAVMTELEVAGWCRAATDERAWDAEGLNAWQINPAIHARFEAHGRRETARRAAIREKIAQAGAARRRL